MRALENQLEWSFPAVKKQVDLLESVDILAIEKDNNKRSIAITERAQPFLKHVFIDMLLIDVKEYLNKF